MAAAVMPGQFDRRDTGAEAFIEDGFQILDLDRLAAAGFLGQLPFEEARRRQLFRIADHHHLPAAADHPDRVPGG